MGLLRVYDLMQKIHFINRVDETNTGEWNSSPLLYFYPFFKDYNIIRHDIEYIKWFEIGSNDVIILGGGGLFNVLDSFNKNIDKLASTGARIIGWGIGFNTHYTDKMYGDHANPPITIPLNTDFFTLVGIRDYNHESGLPWLPCVSAMHPDLAKIRPLKRKIGIIDHKNFPVAGFDGYDRISNSYSMDVITDFIAASEIIVTRSYHMVYYSQMMGKKVICVDPFSNKFNYFKHKPVVYSGDLEADMTLARVYDKARDEAIEVNNNYFLKVKKIVESVMPNTYSGYSEIYGMSRQALTDRYVGEIRTGREYQFKELYDRVFTLECQVAILKERTTVKNIMSRILKFPVNRILKFVKALSNRKNYL
jgi:hypothetical protein